MTVRTPKEAAELNQEAAKAVSEVFAERGAYFVLTGMAELLDREGMHRAAVTVRTARSQLMDED